MICRQIVSSRSSEIPSSRQLLVPLRRQLLELLRAVAVRSKRISPIHDDGALWAISCCTASVGGTFQHPALGDALGMVEQPAALALTILPSSSVSMGSLL